MKDNWKEKLKNLIESVIFCTWDCKNLDVDPPVTEKGMTLEETVKAKLPQFEKFINALLSSQLKEVLGVIESKKVSEMSASEYNEVVLTKDTPQHKNLRHRLTGSHNPSWITAEIYNLALDDIKAELTKLEEEK